MTKAISIAQFYETAGRDTTKLLPQDADSQPVYRVQSAQATGAPRKSATDVQKQDTGQVPVILRKNAVTIVIRLAISNVLVQHLQRAHLSGMYN